jgi:type II secretory pathway predicted ATPase ExeA
MTAMDYPHFGFRRRPFRPTLDAPSACPLEGPDAALSALLRGWSQGDSVAVLTGPAGSGKSLLGLRFLADLPPETPRIWIQAAPGWRAADLFQALLFDLGLPYQGLSEQELRLAVTEALLSQLAEDRTHALILDEAHHLTPELLEQLRLLGNLESAKARALFAVLLGQPRLRDLLNHPESSGFAQRASLRLKLDPLSVDESIRFLRHQIREAGGQPEDAMSDEALALLAQHGRGLPRVLNQVANAAFALALDAGADAVDVEAVLEALQQMELLPPEAERSPGEVPKPQPRTTPSRAAKPVKPAVRRKSA